MLRRLALVAWWLGALYAAFALPAMAFVVLAAKPDMGAVLGSIGGSVVMITGVLWVISFVLGGSFWRPPRQARD